MCAYIYIHTSSHMSSQARPLSLHQLFGRGLTDISSSTSAGTRGRGMWRKGGGCGAGLGVGGGWFQKFVFGRFSKVFEIVGKCVCGCSPSHSLEPNSVLSKTRFMNLSRGTLYMALGSRMGSSRERFKSRVCDKTEFGSNKWLGLQSQTHFLTVSNISEKRPKDRS